MNVITPREIVAKALYGSWKKNTVLAQFDNSLDRQKMVQELMFEYINSAEMHALCDCDETNFGVNLFECAEFVYHLESVVLGWDWYYANPDFGYSVLAPHYPKIAKWLSEVVDGWYRFAAYDSNLVDGWISEVVGHFEMDGDYVYEKKGVGVFRVEASEVGYDLPRDEDDVE